jgi:hypothetical protein
MSASPPRRVCYFHNPQSAGRFGDYEIDTLDPLPYFLNPPRRRVARFLTQRRAAARFAALYTAAGVDALYRERDADYLRFVHDFADRFEHYDAVILATYNPVHPEILRTRLSRPVKVLGFIDDPHSTYVRGIPYLWAFDGAFYISPGYDAAMDFRTALEAWGCRASHWMPLVPHPLPRFSATERFFADRDVDVTYVGNAYGDKIDRLVELKRALGGQLRVHGRWPVHGWAGVARALRGKPIFAHRVTPLSDAERTTLYSRTRIGINMHLSRHPAETGNLRMYEVPTHGAMLLCDKAACGAHEQVFRDGVEAVYYDGVADAIEQIRHFLAHDADRIAIARNGFERVQRDYTYELVLRRLLDWAVAIPRENVPR